MPRTTSAAPSVVVAALVSAPSASSSGVPSRANKAAAGLGRTATAGSTSAGRAGAVETRMDTGATRCCPQRQRPGRGVIRARRAAAKPCDQNAVDIDREQHLHFGWRIDRKAEAGDRVAGPGEIAAAVQAVIEQIARALRLPTAWQRSRHVPARRGTSERESNRARAGIQTRGALFRL